MTVANHHATWVGRMPEEAPFKPEPRRITPKERLARITLAAFMLVGQAGPLAAAIPSGSPRKPATGQTTDDRGPAAVATATATPTPERVPTSAPEILPDAVSPKPKGEPWTLRDVNYFPGEVITHPDGSQSLRFRLTPKRRGLLDDSCIPEAAIQDANRTFASREALTEALEDGLAAKGIAAKARVVYGDPDFPAKVKALELSGTERDCVIAAYADDLTVTVTPADPNRINDVRTGIFNLMGLAIQPTATSRLP